MRLGFHGATGTVTGSKYLVRTEKASVLVDCGLFQGYKQLRLRNWSPLPFEGRALDAVVLTHAHLDHSGYLPLLIRNGYAGPVHCTEATYDLCKILLPDSGRLQEEDAERANRRAYSKHKPALPLYTEKDALRALEHFEPVALHHDFSPAPGLSLRLYKAGHILGSSFVHIDDGTSSLLFTGDLGRPHDPIMHAPEAVEQADYLVVESTYGNRLHEPTDAHRELGEVIVRTIARDGVVVIPSFAVGRTQHLLWCIHRLKSEGTIPATLPVYLNSPMAQDVTAVYHRHRVEHRLSPDECQAMCHAASYVNSVEDSKALNRREGPMVIIAGSGMATGGRVVHHLRAFAPDAKNTIVFAGFQAGGTRGAAMLAGAESIKVFGEYVAVRAEIAQISNLSAHADYAETLDWLRGFRTPPKRTFITHGEPGAADAMRVHIEETLGWRCRVPDYREQVELAGSTR
ncbi:MBL fold metallo-hydrolase RNA specificity domain-containing protein [Pseudomonas aeruginosa]|uniref:mRNA 3'-end processing factor n=1 Tax=Immundisolibacter cernigliae TaxID=1810504 RepID=A0A1B1YT96_9GAMM|nr:MULTISPECIES: MBL fold metallo-hydrolase [Gammaproteobacteria]ANX03942.1 mRNA 3'-end processing factor [Immundisolibacter cernigliae]EIZ0539866.1 MBL fold metallo-hydrolase [Pseudomonas aeruginosa]EKV4127233.1 MBL fold metallo-hydrolase [Pseudomonas aeruginosa]EKW0411111.1 MBL fold metallo-hydrolase [Pseudomonas aeruginosa]EKW1417679.1 MBL fold metallo-hydrolase [Pseudomonas aeruginosa]